MMPLLVILVIVLLGLILAALLRGNALRAAQLEAERERQETAEQQREYDMFFATNNYPHRQDDVRLRAWAAQRGWTVEQAHEFLLEGEIEDSISQSLEEAKRQRVVTLRKHGWEAEYVALAFTAEQRSGEAFRPIHGMIWKPGGAKYFLNLVNLSAYVDAGCSANFPLQERSVEQGTFTIEKAQRYGFDEASNELRLFDID